MTRSFGYSDTPAPAPTTAPAFTVSLPDPLVAARDFLTIELLISPAERPPITELGRVSPIPESLGADVAWLAADGSFVGVQRKAIPDLVSSVHDGRLALEVAQLNQCAVKAIVIEGSPRWTADGNYLSTIGPQTSYHRRRHEGLLTSLQQAGIIVMHSESAVDTCRVILDFAGHVTEGSDSGLSVRPKTPPKTRWGNVTSESWAIWTLQSFVGVGVETARAIVAHFGGLPLAWTVTEADLRTVPGVGKKRARDLIAALEREGGKAYEDS